MTNVVAAPMKGKFGGVNDEENCEPLSVDLFRRQYYSLLIEVSNIPQS